MASALPNPGDVSTSIDSPNAELWAYSRGFLYPDQASDLPTSWVDDFSCLFTEVPSLADPALAAEHEDTYVASSALDQLTAAVPGATTSRGAENLSVPLATEGATPSILHGPLPQNGQPAGLSASPQACDPTFSGEDSTSELSKQSAELIRHFLRITQPPAAILIGGSKRWRRLQEYLCKASERCRPVEDALLCVVGLLTIGDTSKQPADKREEFLLRIHERHQHSCDGIRTILTQHRELKPQIAEFLLAAIFLLAWFEVIRDQDDRHSLFPRDLADSVISTKATWSRYSQELLSWMNTLDSKAAHLAGEHLLSQQTIDMISHYQTQITSSSALDVGVGNVRLGSLDTPDGPATVSSLGSASELDFAQPQRLEMNSPVAQQGQVKQAVLNSILQPALQWYLTSQSYCRRISAHDMYHRRRSTSDDEYEIITACKQLESELSEHWNYRPTVISLTAEQLMQVVSSDLATRLEEIFSVYLASFWALFLYLYRVSWWKLPHSLPHSATMQQALNEIWRSFQRAYGEAIEGTTKKVVHPSLLWPLFLFGCEVADLKQREWVIQQLEDLGEMKPVLEEEELEADMLPPFRMSSGATRNAKRAAVLLSNLIEQQDQRQCKVDARELSMKLFGCHFSLV